MHALGADFTRSALENHDNYVSARVSNPCCIIQLAPHPPAGAPSHRCTPTYRRKTGSVPVWDRSDAQCQLAPRPIPAAEVRVQHVCGHAGEVLSDLPHRVNALSPIVDPEIVSVVDLVHLRALCSHGKSARLRSREGNES